MKNIVIAVKDLAQQAYMQPQTVRHPAQALRGFTEETNRADRQNQLYTHPQDFELWQLATFDDETGQFENTPERIARAQDVQRTPD